MGKPSKKPTKKPAAKSKRVQTRTIDKRPAFLAAYVASASLTAAAAAVKVDRTMHYRWLLEPEYAAQYAMAREQAGHTLEDDAIHWARIGVYEPLVFQGQFQYRDYRDRVICTLKDGSEVFEEQLPEGVEPEKRRNVKIGVGPPLGIHRRSEGLMARLLKAFLPGRYGDRTQMELSGPNGGPIPLDDKRLQSLTDDELAQLISVAKKLAVAGEPRGGDPAKAKEPA